MKRLKLSSAKTRIEEVKDSSSEADIEWFSYYDVRGIGKSRTSPYLQSGVLYVHQFHRTWSSSLSLYAIKTQKKTVRLSSKPHNGEIGDGHIFVIPIEERYPHPHRRTGYIALW